MACGISTVVSRLTGLARFEFAICVVGSKSCKIDDMVVSGCAQDAQSCDLPRGTTVTTFLKFTTLSKLVLS